MHSDCASLSRRRLCLALALARCAALQPSVPTPTRRLALAAAGAALLPLHRRAGASELWPRDGLFPDCPTASDACVSSQDDRPAAWDNPWIAEGSVPDAMARLREVVERRLGGRVLASDERFLRAEFTESTPLGSSVDVAEWFYAPDDELVQFRAARRGDAISDFGANRRRLEKARIALGWEKVPVLRNRRRAFVVGESPFDSFGPALYSETYDDKDPLASPFEPPSKLLRQWARESDDRVRSR